MRPRALRPTLVAAVAAAAMTGCATSEPWRGYDASPVAVTPVDPARPVGAPAAAAAGWQSRVTAMGRSLPPLPRTALHLPAVSPDHRWIAFVTPRDEVAASSDEAAVTGRGLDGFELRIRELDAEGDGRVITHAACWPSWSADGDRLVFITYDARDRCYLGLHDPAAGTTRLKAVGLRRMMMPRFSPAGDAVAVSAYREAPARSAIFTIDLDHDRAVPGPPATGRAQVLPRWIGPDALAFIELGDADAPATLRGYRLGDDDAVQLAELFPIPSVFDGQHVLAGVADAVTDDAGAYAAFDVARGRLVLIDLETGRRLPLPRGTVAGSWFGRGWFVAAGDRDLRLLQAPPASTADAAEAGAGVRLFDGRWAPLRADADRRSLVLLGTDPGSGRFKLVQLWLIVEGHPGPSAAAP